MPATTTPPISLRQSEKAKLIRRVSRLVKSAGLDYDGFRYVCQQVRRKLKLKPPRSRKRDLPAVLTSDQFRRLYEIVDQANDPQHAVMLRLLFYTGVRVSELCNLRVQDVDAKARKIRVNEGKGGKDRYVLFADSFATTLRVYLAGRTEGPLFPSRQGGAITPRRVQQIVKQYAEAAGVVATPHTFRHQAITWLTRHSGMADAELQLITGHSKRETLAVYQHVALDSDLEQKYQQAMAKTGL